MNHTELGKLQRQFDKLPVEEKFRRMDYLLNYYLGLLTDDAKWVVDATKHWPQFELMKEQEENDQV